jgi:nucleotide-binding universal stress UspA family protein
MPEPPAGFVRPLPPRHVLVGTDGSPTATEAARRAAVLAASARARLTVACVYSRGAPTAATSGPGVLGYLATSARDPYGIPWDARWRVTRAAEAEEIVRRAAELCRHCGCTTVETTVVAGEPASALVGLAAELPADLVVVGSKGLRSWARFVIGNVPDTVVRQAHCDVLVVRTD